MTRKLVVVLTAGLATGWNLNADVLKLKNGQNVQGVFVSGNSREIAFLGADGMQKTYPVTSINGMEFATLPPAAPAAPAVPAATSSGVVIPAGTQAVVRMIDTIDGKTARGGARYRASLDDPIAIGSQVAIPQGASATVEVVEVQQGKELALRLRDVTVGGKVYSFSTEYAEVAATGTSKTKKAVRRGVGLGALGAGIGAAAGGGQGAAIGAAVGGGVGVASAAMAKGKNLSVPSETRLIFALKAPVPMN